MPDCARQLRLLGTVAYCAFALMSMGTLMAVWCDEQSFMPRVLATVYCKQGCIMGELVAANDNVTTSVGLLGNYQVISESDYQTISASDVSPSVDQEGNDLENETMERTAKPSPISPPDAPQIVTEQDKNTAASVMQPKRAYSVAVKGGDEEMERTAKSASKTSPDALQTTPVDQSKNTAARLMKPKSVYKVKDVVKPKPKERKFTLSDYPSGTKITRMFKGPVAPYWDKTQRKLVYPLADEKKAICAFSNDVKQSFHFPHAMQQLLRCFSWWKANARHGQQWVLLKPPFDNVQPFMQRVMHYTDAFVEVLQKAFKVQVITDHRYSKSWIKKHAVVPTPYGRPYPYEMRNLKDAQKLRDGILKHFKLYRQKRQSGCPAANDQLVDNKQQPVIGFLNRNGGRHVTNHWAIRNATGVHAAYYLASFDNKSFAEQVAWMSHIDILISPHGAQLTSIPYMPACGGILELFPKGYLLPQYFGSLATVTGHHHAYIYTGNYELHKEEKRYKPEQGEIYGKHSPVKADPAVVAEAVQELTRQWRTCCAAQQPQQQQQQGGNKNKNKNNNKRKSSGAGQTTTSQE